MDEESIYRQNKIQEILDQEVRDGEDMAFAVKEMAYQMLIREKGFLPSEVERDVSFALKINGKTEKSSLDLVISSSGKKAMIIKCAAGSIVSRERHIVAAGRVFSAASPVPVAVVMDRLTANVLDTVTGEVIGEGFQAIPTKKQLSRLISEIKSVPLSAERLEKEKRILLAFDGIQCSIPQGGNGGVKI